MVSISNSKKNNSKKNQRIDENMVSHQKPQNETKQIDSRCGQTTEDTHCVWIQQSIIDENLGSQQKPQNDTSKREKTKNY